MLRAMSFPTLSPWRRPLRSWSLLPLLLTVLTACEGREEPPVAGTRGVLLVGNTRADNIVVVDEESGALLATLVPGGSGGLVAPDAMVFGPDGNLYVASGDTADNSAILRFDPRSGRFIDRFASGGGLIRPYGMAFGPDGLLYVSSFLTDQILRYDATTGAFVDIFARGSGSAGGLNGPNQLKFGPDGLLYVTTQGSVAIGGQPTFPGLPSQVLRFNILTRGFEVFADQPPLLPDGQGYISLLGLEFGPDCDVPGGACDLFVSDFANGIRRYDLTTKQIEATLATNYLGTPKQNNLGGLAFGADDRLYTVGFDNRNEGGFRGALLRFNGQTNAPLPAEGKGGALFVEPTEQLVRPIFILYQRRPTT
jgi:DNA-binding beta-propeller fold protein YncE